MGQEDKRKQQRFEAMIDDNLKRLYSDLVQEDLPDRFKDLLSQLKDQDVQQGSKK